jgi:hypothetical protein
MGTLRTGFNDGQEINPWVSKKVSGAKLGASFWVRQSRQQPKSLTTATATTRANNPAIDGNL